MPTPGEAARIGLLSGTCVGFVVAGLVGATTATAFVSTVAACMAAGAAIAAGAVMIHEQDGQLQSANDNPADGKPNLGKPVSEQTSQRIEALLSSGGKTQPSKAGPKTSGSKAGKPRNPRTPKPRP